PILEAGSVLEASSVLEAGSVLEARPILEAGSVLEASSVLEARLERRRFRPELSPRAIDTLEFEKANYESKYH
ncbi:hypothetical protein BOX15_Mlig022918g1, partial [Macrostomum lignano]